MPAFLAASKAGFSASRSELRAGSGREPSRSPCMSQTTSARTFLAQSPSSMASRTPVSSNSKRVVHPLGFVVVPAGQNGNKRAKTCLEQQGLTRPYFFSSQAHFWEVPLLGRGPEAPPLAGCCCWLAQAALAKAKGSGFYLLFLFWCQNFNLVLPKFYKYTWLVQRGRSVL